MMKQTQFTYKINITETSQIKLKTQNRTGEHWMQRITFTADTNAACTALRTHTLRDSERHNIFPARKAVAKVINLK